jgi:hypothetical protein
MTAGQVTFAEGHWSGTHGQDGFFTRDAWLPATALIGQLVNLGTKGGTVYERALVTAVTSRGELTVQGGRKGWPHHPGQHPEDVTTETLPVREVARGFIHEPSPGLTCSECGAAMWISSTGTAHHWGGGPENTDHDADARHVPISGEGLDTPADTLDDPAAQAARDALMPYACGLCGAEAAYAGAEPDHFGWCPR